MVDQTVLDALQTTPLEELDHAIDILAHRLYQHRKEHNGYVPSPTFEPVIGVAGTYLEAEVIVAVYQGEEFVGFALKKRTDGEQGWRDLYHIPGQYIRMTDQIGHSDVFPRLVQEIFGEDPSAVGVLTNVAYLGLRGHHEPERFATCWTITYQLSIFVQEFPHLSGEWKIFRSFDNVEIVDHHRWALSWASDPHREPVVYLGPSVARN